MTESQEREGLRLLSLDGGGIRGLSELLILREIMKRIRHDDNLPDVPAPCDYFDLIGGTGTGGIIALFLGRLRMSISEAIESYDRLARTVFSDAKRFSNEKFKATKLEEVLKEIIRHKTRNVDEPMMDPRPEKEACKTFACAMPQKNLSGGIPRLFRSYTTRANEAADCKIWEAARATSAEPRFFKPIIIREESVSEAYVDGGLGHNNPIQLVLEEAKQVFHGRKVACIISVGAGQPGTISMPGSSRFHQITEAMQGIAADCEKSAEEVARHFQNIPDVYFRFNVEQGMQQYLRNTHVDKLLDKAVAAVWKREGIVPTGRLGT